MRIVILGNGISGITTARFIRKNSDHEIIVVSEEHDYFFSRTALMYVYMGHMRFKDIQPYEDWFWEKNRIQRKNARVSEVDFEGKKLITKDGESIEYDKLVLAVGSKSNKFGWPGQDLDGVHGLYHKQDLEAMERHSPGLQRAVIVGGGLIGIEMAEMFHSRNIPVTFLVRENSFWNVVLPAEESAMINRHIVEHHIDLRLETELDYIEDDGSGKCCAVHTNSGERIECGFVGLTAGVSPNIEFLKNSSLETNRGILVNQNLETNILDVYAIGDCAEMREPQPGRRPIEAVWYTGRIMGEALGHTLCGNSTPYDPGIWFNSAKFFDIEYQVYGDIRAKLPEGQKSLYWEHPDGKKSIRINYHSDSMAVLGFNLMGIRYRHEVCEKWIREEASMEVVLKNLGIANFDPEFYPQHEKDLVAEFNRQNGTTLSLKKRRGLAGALSFLNS